MAVYSSVVSKLELAADVPEDAHLGAHHVKGNDGKTIKFQNPHPSAGDPPGSIIMTSARILWSMVTGEASRPDTSDVKIPAVKPEFLKTRTSSTVLRATWLGHACYFVEFPSGLRVLFDPVFEDRCAPVQWFGPKRYSPPPCALSDLPAVDAVIISHSHYDHLSHTSVQELARRHPKAHFFVGLGLEKWFHDSGITNVTEMDWWQDADLVLQREKHQDEEKTAPDTISARISCLPCQHSSGRSHRDQNHTLWASWAVKSGEKSVWFGGDTGYRRVPRVPLGVDDYGPEYDSLPRCPQFTQIGRLRGPFDLGLIPIGAYKPRWLFSWMHANPYDAVEIFKDTRCHRAMGIHWGTWVLTSEDVEEPPRLLKQALKTSGIPETGVFDVCAIGETREFPTVTQTSV
ncbi:beta-lactamase superfamily domain-containing protein [Corynascus novoguineensis]|uniref:Beta-lactamase superfamily domain-containing protein n=1 Tax=Corynascus novoguineensis TaxID=1126955 RepID=A0AAN7HUJ3_9PEZI|nr:beta-lactamase superfamily domain-containing protein [Corynascus novoguineensis]